MRILIIAFLFISCSKVNPESGVYCYKGNESKRVSTSPYTLAFGSGYQYQIEGIRTTFNVENLGTEPGRSAWCSGLIQKIPDGSGTTDSANWFQMGIQENAIPVIQSYYTPVSEVQIINANVPVVKGRRYTFWLKHIGNNYWETGRQPEGTADVPVLRFVGCAGILHNPQTGIEYYSSNAKFPLLNFNPAIELYVGGQWVRPLNAYISYLGKFNMRLNSINNIDMGSRLPVPVSTILW
jgi:hypothetical protein